MTRSEEMEAPSSTVGRTARKAPRLFKAICVLIILGNVLLIVVNMLKAGMLLVGSANGSVGQSAIGPLNALLLVVILSCVGAIVGAALMLGGKRLGFRIYAASNMVHLLATVCVMLLWFMTVYLSVVGVLLFLYCFIPVGFLLYFTLNKEWLR